ncbi:hypothetical protein CMO93_03620 [Candidatus Woesearchaeota archaeon]|nr:hypothetical protein [Candidatus Woesearchaeota archaeon]|tara:strand:+ start:195 stop:935 length:741 start_codon:yes stop_codon:yes gene_type:complete
MVFENVLNPIFSPLLNLPTLWAVILLSFIVSLIITIIYKYSTDQDLMKQLKQEMKAFQKQIKELKKEPEKAMQVQKEAMKTNMKYMTQSMKSTLYSFIPIILIFGWMNANFAYAPILPNQEFTTTVTFQDNVDGKIELSVPEGIAINGPAKKEIKDRETKWLLSGERGEYLLEYIFNGKKYNKELLIAEKQYKPPLETVKDGTIKSISIDHSKRIVLPFLNWGWLGTYIIFSIAFSIIVRKIIKVY